MNLLVTGAAGFIGSHFVRLAVKSHPEWTITILDALTYAGNLSTIKDIRERVHFVAGKIQDPTAVEGVIKDQSITHIVNFAAESHNDRSILEAGSFIQTDVLGTYVLLEATKKFGVERLVHVSTDEVYGTIDQGEFAEDSPIEPNTPYSASKAGGDLQVRAHVKAFGTPAIITRGGNTYGPYQFPEKLIPFFATRLIDGKKVPLYGEGTQIREWIHAEDHASGILTVLKQGNLGEIYNVGDTNERQNHEVVKILLEATGRGDDLVKRIPDPRKGAHDARYSMTSAKLRGLGWTPSRPFEQALIETVQWYQKNESWWRPLIETPDFQAFVKRFYGPSLGEDL
jgi:dTDP-glucose 4,6-dehydratase